MKYSFHDRESGILYKHKIKNFFGADSFVGIRFQVLNQVFIHLHPKGTYMIPINFSSVQFPRIPLPRTFRNQVFVGCNIRQSCHVWNIYTYLNRAVRVNEN